MKDKLFKLLSPHVSYHEGYKGLINSFGGTYFEITDDGILYLGKVGELLDKIFDKKYGELYKIFDVDFVAVRKSNITVINPYLIVIDKGNSDLLEVHFYYEDLDFYRFTKEINLSGAVPSYREIKNNNTTIFVYDSVMEKLKYSMNRITMSGGKNIIAYKNGTFDYKMSTNVTKKMFEFVCKSDPSKTEFLNFLTFYECEDQKEQE